MNIVVLIPARSGSKRLKYKNILKLKGLPLIVHTIKFARKITGVKEVFVSTDSEKIKAISKKYNAEVPFLRPKKYSKDNSKDLDVFKHFLRWYRKNNKKEIDLIIHLRPTTPFRSLKKVHKAINLFKKNKNYDSLRSFTESDFTPYKMWKKSGNVAKPLFYDENKEFHSMGKQELPKTYNHIGIIDIMRPKKTIDKNSMVGKKTFFFLITDNKNYIDIDKRIDYEKAKKLKL